jgi:uncharacterized membrane protein
LFYNKNTVIQGVLKIKHYFKKFVKSAEHVSDWVADISAHPLFIIFHAIWWGVWIGFGIEPFPYGLLTLIVSLEAILLSSLLLSSGNREGEAEKKIARKDLRISTQTNIMVEEIHDVIRDMQEDLRNLMDDKGE